jgi:hypothetical protein
MAFKINNKIGPYFQSHKGVRQGDPLSILLFNMVADCITRMVLRAQQNKRIVDLVDHLFSNGVMTQYCVYKRTWGKQGISNSYIFMSR